MKYQTFELLDITWRQETSSHSDEFSDLFINTLLSIFSQAICSKMFVIKVAALYINNRYENIVNLLLINCFDESFFGNTLSICLRVCTPDRICRYDPSFVFPTAFNQSLSYFIWFLKNDFFCNNIAAIFFPCISIYVLFYHIFSASHFYFSLYNTGRVIVLLVIIIIVPLPKEFRIKI